MAAILTRNNDIQQLKVDYEKKCVQYKALGDLIKLYLYEGLTSNNISFTDIQFRIKSFHSFISKIKRKKYFDNPYSKIEDILGVRVICTFKEDIPKVSKIIETALSAQPPEDKELKDENKLIGYRGRHQIVQLKDEICNNLSFYKKLKGLKAEIQIRTNVQHSWAEVSHKLNYKDEDNVPTEFKDMLAQISGALALIDKHYTDLKREKEALQNRLKRDNVKSFQLEQEVNIDTLTTFLDLCYSNRDSADDIELLFEEMIEHKINFKAIVDKQNQLGNRTLSRIEREISSTSKHSQVGIVRLILSLYFKSYWKQRKRILSLYSDGNKRIKIIEKWQKNF